MGYNSVLELLLVVVVELLLVVAEQQLVGELLHIQLHRQLQQEPPNPNHLFHRGANIHVVHHIREQKQLKKQITLFQI
jgi:hypothetical protein